MHTKKLKTLCMDKITTEEGMYKLDMFQSLFGKIDEFGWWDLEIISEDAGMQIYLHGVQVLMPNPRCSFDVSRSGTPGNERKVQINMENVTYNCTLTYGTCKSFGIVYSFFINVYDISYFYGTTNQIPDKKRRRSDRSI